MPLDESMSDWREVRLGSVGAFYRGQGGTKADERNDGVPCVRYGELYTKHHEVIRSIESFVAPERAHTYTSLQVGDVVFAGSGETHEEIGKAAVFLGPEPAVVGADTIVFRPSSEIHPAYAGYAVNTASANRYKARAGQGSSVIHIGSGSLSELRVGLPSFSEQNRIAEILDTLDEAIRNTEQVIAKLQQMKQGLLHDLLTRGIDERGELRDPDRHPEQFKDSPLGRIPREWAVEHLGDLLDGVIDFRGRTPKKLGMEWGGGPIPALSAKNVRPGKIDLTQETYYGSEALYQRWMTSGDTAKGDVLLTMEAPLGNIAQIPDEQRYILSQRVVLLKFSASIALNDFMAVQMRDSRFQANLRRWSTGTTATGIQRAKLVCISVVVPPTPEQRSIATTIESSGERIGREFRMLDKLRTLKDGLMEDLLTGRVRVTIPSEAAA